MEQGLGPLDAEVLKVGERRFAQDRLAATLQGAGAGRDCAGALPLAAGGFLAYEFLPVGPLKPLGMLIQGK